MLLIVISLIAMENVGRGFSAIFRPINDGFHWLGYTREDVAAPYFRLFMSPLILGAVMSGPPLLLNLVFGWLASRFELVISPRKDTKTLTAEGRPGSDPREVADPAKPLEIRSL
jgi:hypothetical protein